MTKTEMTFKMAARPVGRSAGEPRAVAIPRVEVFNHGAPTTLDQLPEGRRVKLGEKDANDPRVKEDEELFWSAP